VIENLVYYILFNQLKKLNRESIFGCVREVITIGRSFPSGDTTPREIECVAPGWVRGGEDFQFDISLDARAKKEEIDDWASARQLLLRG